LPKCIRILQIGDIHLPEWSPTPSPVDLKDKAFSTEIVRDISNERLRQVLRRIHDIGASGGIDCVAVMGDFTSYGKSNFIGPAIEIIDSLLRGKSGERPPVVGVPGNHDVDKPTAAKLGKKGKFNTILAEFEKRDWKRAPIDECLSHDIPMGDSGNLSILLLNSSIGSWSKHILPKALQADFKDSDLTKSPIAASAAATEDLAPVNVVAQLAEPATRDDQLFTQLDTPYISRNSLETLNQKLAKCEHRTTVLVAHHNLLPQRVPRILAYGELLNAGAFRDFLHQSQKNIIYLHGHIHEDPVECVFAPKRDFSETETTQIVTISAPRLTDGFNEVSLFIDDDGEVFLVRVTKYRPDRLNMIGNFSDQETLHIPMLTKFGDLITGAGRKIWQIIKDEGRLNWREVLDRTRALEVSEETLEYTILKLFCCRLIRVSQLGRSRKKWVVEAVERKHG
jgi:3',5'-cyclic AMP phosphodiesterase CpdA